MDPTLTSRWTPPEGVVLDVGRPIACIATTYEFQAEYFERELLPRFLGLRYDVTEGDRPFQLENDLNLREVHACVLVDRSRFDRQQSSLLWDQLPVHVPSGIQHAKVVLLAWEHLVRVIVASANLNRPGYRRNREVAGVLDFHDARDSTPRSVALQVLDFLSQVQTLARAPEANLARLRETIAQVRTRVESWTGAPAEFGAREVPRVEFVPCIPPIGGRGAASPVERLVELWGRRRTSSVDVMTPFVGEGDRPSAVVIERLLEVSRARDCSSGLIVPGQPVDDRSEQMQVKDIPRAFLETWARAWRVPPDEVPVWVVPPARPGEESNRTLHAKAIYLEGDSDGLLLCGSSNFTPHGMGVRAYNLEANLCYLDRLPASAKETPLSARLPVDWERDETVGARWPDSVPPPEDAVPGEPVAPPVFLWAALDQRNRLLTIGLDPAQELPATWSVRLPGVTDGPALAGSQDTPGVPEGGRLEIPLTAGQAALTLTAVLIEWTDPEGSQQRAILPVLAERPEDLLPPRELRGMGADLIIKWLLSGADHAALVAAQLRGAGVQGPQRDELDPLRLVRTDAYLTYRIRRLGRALGGLGQRLLVLPMTERAFRHWLFDDPIGPMSLADALIRDWDLPAGHPQRPALRTGLGFAIGEISLLLANTWSRLASRTDDAADLTPFRELFATADRELRERRAQVLAEIEAAPGLSHYLGDVDQLCDSTFTADSGSGHAR